MTEPQRDPLDASVDNWLDSADNVAPSPQLRRVIAEIPVRHPHSGELRMLWPFGSFWKAVSMGVVICVLGVIAGASSVEASTTESSVETDDSDVAFAISLTEGTEP
jgi:hypothetical protein